MRLVALAVLAFTVCACPGIMHPLEKPRAELTSIAIQDVSITSGVTIAAHLEVTNPNSVGLPLRAIDWQASLDGRAIARGRIDAQSTIPAKGSAPVDATFTIGPGQAAALVGALSNGAATLLVDGTMHFQTSLGNIAAEFSHEQSLSKN